MKGQGNDNRDIAHLELEEGDVPEEWLTHKLPSGKAQRTGRDGRVMLRVAAEAVEVLGGHGRLISSSKSAYRRAHPDHEVYFNACLFSEAGEEIWFGDVDLTLEEEKLEELAAQIGTIYLTPEHPYRFEGFSPRKAEGDDRVRRYPGAAEEAGGDRDSSGDAAPKR